MELSECVQRGLKSLADPSVFDQRAFAVLLDACFRSVLSAPADASVLVLPELETTDQIVVKQSHTAMVTFILESAKLNADKSTLSTCLEELSFNAERIEIFHNVYEKHKTDIIKLLSCIGRRLPEINDVSWRLQYQIKSAQVDKVDKPFYLITLNTENEAGSSEDVNFTCTVEQLQDLVGKIKDAAKSMERASQM
ncbi:unnamed protein product [Knipowitschia caucasica]